MTKKTKKKTTKKKELLSLVKSARSDYVAHYANTGRQHARLSDEALTEAWQKAFRAMARSPRSSELTKREADLSAELSLRQLEPPYETVKEAAKEFISSVDRHIADLEADSEGYDRANEGIEEELADFRAKKDRAN